MGGWLSAAQKNVFQMHHLFLQNCRSYRRFWENLVTKISFENPDKINGLLTLVVEEEDYKNDVEKTLKDYRKKETIGSS